MPELGYGGTAVELASNKVRGNSIVDAETSCKTSMPQSG